MVPPGSLPVQLLPAPPGPTLPDEDEDLMLEVGWRLRQAAGVGAATGQQWLVHNALAGALSTYRPLV